MDTSKFVRKPFEIDAVQVTVENIDEVAKWCEGEIVEGNGSTSYPSGSGRHIKVDVHHPLSPRQTQAFIGDWILASRKGFKVYTDSAFRGNFVPKGEIEDDEDGPEYTSDTAEHVRSIFDKGAIEELVQKKVEEALAEQHSVFDRHFGVPPTTYLSQTPVDPKDAIGGKR